jgi:hypothetical protein
MIDTVRGVSIHTTSQGLQHYVHYEINGTVMVNEQEHQVAVQELSKWQKKVNVKQFEKAY